MEEKIDAFMAGLIVSVLIYVAVSCETRPAVIAAGESVVSSQISAVRIEAINGELRTIISSYDSFIEREAGRAVGGIEAALDRLDEYDSFVQGLIYRIRELERATRNLDDEVSNAVPGSGYWVNPFLD